jgi:16S rRNA (uracil1498-N3)-methyltransferase
MNLILLFEDDFIGGTGRVRLLGRRQAHVLGVHRAQVGETLRVGLLNGQLGTGRITAFGAAGIEMDVTLDQAPPAVLPLTLLLALPRPKSVKRVLQAVTAMGAKRIVLMNAWRVEKSFWESPALQPEALRQQLVLGLEQACDTRLPEIWLRPRFKPFVEDELPALMRHTRALLAHPHALQPCPRGVPDAVTLAVGPEGGFIAYEIELLQAHGFEAVSLGPRILRVEHAVPALLGRLF